MSRPRTSPTTPTAPSGTPKTPQVRSSRSQAAWARPSVYAAFCFVHLATFAATESGTSRPVIARSSAGHRAAEPEQPLDVLELAEVALVLRELGPHDPSLRGAL